MAKKNEKVVQLHRQQEEFLNTTPAEVSEIFPGFSARINQFIDLTDLNIPHMDEGRQAYIANLFQSSKMAPGDWLKKDKPPKPSTLRKIVLFLLTHIKGDYNPLRVEAWLKYGDGAVTNPFRHSNPDNEALIPLAASLIASVAKEIDVQTTHFDLNQVLNGTIETLSDFQITHESMVEPVHRKIIAQHIRSNPRNS